MHQQRLAFRQLATPHQRDISGEVRRGVSGRDAIIRRAGNGTIRTLRPLRFLREAAGQRAADHAVAVFEPRHAGAGRDHIARAFAAHDERKLRSVLILALNHQDVGKIHRRRAHADAHVVRAQFRQRHVFDLRGADIVRVGAAQKRSHAPEFSMALPSATGGSERMPPRNSAVAKSAAALGSASARRAMRSDISNATPTMAAIR